MFAVSRANNPNPNSKPIGHGYILQASSTKPKVEIKPRFIVSHKEASTNETQKKVELDTKLKKKLKFRLSITRDCLTTHTNSTSGSLIEKNARRSKDGKHKPIRRRDGNFHCGRWQPDEHQRFIEAIMKYGNEWKQVQKYVGTRSSTQARSHAQKFFVKIKNSNLFDYDFNFSKNSIKTLHNLAHSLTADEYFNALKVLNDVAFERKAHNLRRKRKDDALSTDSFMNDINSTMYSNTIGFWYIKF
jgi:SHAQKYF class myb-like DNA-binding protein